MTSVGNNDALVDQSPAEQQPHLNNWQNENLVTNQSNLERVVKPINIAKKKPMIPTRLYVFSFIFQLSLCIFYFP